MKLKLAVFALVTLLATTYTLVRYARIGADLFEQPYRVSVDLADASGLFEHAEVTYLGVQIGRVERLSVAPEGARAVLRLQNGTQVPSAGLTAVVANRSGVGEQYLDLRPSDTAQPYLREGDVIARGQTRLPVSTAQLLGDADRLLASLDPKDVETVVDELDHALRGSGPHLNRLLDATDELVGAADDVLPETVSLLRNGETVLDTQRTSGVRAFARDLASFTASLRQGRPDLVRTVDGVRPAALATERLVDGVAPNLRPLLTNLVVGGQTLSARVPALRQLLIGYPAGVAGAFTVIDDRGLHFGLDLNLNVPRVCRRGYDTRRRYPQDTTVKPARLGSYCKEPKDSATDVRGSRNAPLPLATPTIAGLDPWLAGYDPAIDQVRGEATWQALLLGPLGS
ncbi:MCE family protein [Nonomuraea sp. NPDC050556]|uniref:MCE family protein n=1 Tax=Nonomuraea sp. NPDC050556 TaxID=3364369 RepID=UPI0037B1E9A4